MLCRQPCPAAFAGRRPCTAAFAGRQAGRQCEENDPQDRSDGGVKTVFIGSAMHAAVEVTVQQRALPFAPM